MRLISTRVPVLEYYGSTGGASMRIEAGAMKWMFED